MNNLRRLFTLSSTLAKAYPINNIRNNNFKQIAACRYYSSEVIFTIESSEEFDEKVMNSPYPVLVDFYADWCSPCQQLGPRLEAKVSNLGGQVSLAKINVDEVGNLADEFEISAIPTILGMKNGEVISKFEGMVDDETLDRFIADIVEN
ncbi:Thioredoxin, mitochondrial [Strongyloides ratti]|uniref:Thioredoxin, mitochondrial n=1 Tax=Strongyloides ratti TaxID=34506 RepID=A0A090LE24_STRRB|nr:Thioredoxin, mitochondrial [Strongyloides ratti]CEF68012.1 Thioredoxin, mitochondrial [Strongyloides ratti]